VHNYVTLTVLNSCRNQFLQPITLVKETIGLQNYC